MSCSAVSNRLIPRTPRQSSFTDPTRPKSRRARRPASSSECPASRCLQRAMAKWNSTSSSSSCSTRARNISARRRKTRSPRVKAFSSGQFQHFADGTGHSRPVIGLPLKLPSPRSRQSIEAGTASQLGNTPLGLDPALVFETMKRRIQRTLVRLEHILRYLADSLGNCPPMHGTAGLQSAENEQVQGPLQKIEARPLSHWCRSSTPNKYRDLCRMSTSTMGSVGSRGPEHWLRLGGPGRSDCDSCL